MIPGAVVGWDFTAALALGSALGIDPRIVAEIIPDIEAVAIREINKQMKESSDGC